MIISACRSLAICCSVALVGSVALAEGRDHVVAAHYPPLMDSTNTDRPGYAVEVFQEAARRANRTFDLQFLPFERAMHTILSQENVLMPALFYGKKRDDLFRWVVEIQRARLSFSTIGEPISDLSAARLLDKIVVEAGTTGDVFLTQLGFENLVRVHSPKNSARMLDAGRVDAWFLTGRMMQSVWNQVPTTNALTVGDVVHEVPVYLVASKGLPEDSADAYKNAVDSMRADGSLRKILQRYE